MPTAPQRPVPQSPAPQSLAPENSAPENSALDQPPRPVQNFQVSSPPARDSSTITVHPSVYRGGYVGRPIPGLEEIFQSIVCENDYAHLSPEELRFLDHPARWDLRSFEEARLRYYLDEGRTSVPQFGPPTSAPAFSVSSEVKSTSSEVVSSAPGSESSHLGLGYPVPMPTFDGESTTPICSLCAARLSADSQAPKEHEELGGDKPTRGASRHYDTRGRGKRGKISRRVRRLEKTVESLLHGLTLALKELNDFRGRSIAAGGCKPDHFDTVDAVSTALSRLSNGVDYLDSTSRAPALDTILLQPSESPDPTTRGVSATQCTSTKLGALSRSGESKFGPTAEPTENESTPFNSINRSPVSGLLKPILDFMTCPEVFRFLKRAEAHPGLRCTQLFDLFWVADNLFNVHGGILIYCLQKSFIPMDAISGDSGSSAWSQDPELMQKLDETYRKHLRPHIDTDGSRNIVAKVAWESYCFELGGVFSKQFPGWKSAIAYFQNLSRDYDCLGPIITSSYIEDLNSLWTEVHPALLEVTRWLEPFIDHGPDYLRATPLYDATIALRRHARELFNRQGGPKEPAISSAIRANNLMRLLYERRSVKLRSMQREMESVMIGAVSRDVDTAELADRAKQVTLWRVTEPNSAQMQDTLARREVRAMMGYRPRLLREGTAAARIRSEVFDVLVQTGRWTDAKGEPMSEREVFWDGIPSL